MSKIYYCIDKSSLSVLSAGRLPDTWGQITGLSGVTDDAAADLTWAGYPDHGFFTCTAALDMGVPAQALDAALVVGGELIRADIIRATSDRLEAFASSGGYDSVTSCTSYAVSGNPKYRAEALCMVALRDQTWDALHAILKSVDAGERDVPVAFADVEADLPALQWPTAPD